MRIPALTRLVLLSGSALVLAGCIQGPDFLQPDMAVPDSFRSPVELSEATSIADLPWWELFNDPVLQNLIGLSLAHNADIGIAVARVNKARAIVGVVESQGLPQVGYEAGAGAEQTFIPFPSAPTEATFVGARGGINASWEFDIWGRIQHSSDAAIANLYAEDEVRRGVMLALVSEVATAYFKLLALDHQLRIAQDSSGVYGENVKFFKDRFDAGRDSELAVERARANYAHSQERIADIKGQVALQENVLSLLIGGFPQGMPRGKALNGQRVPTVPVGATTVLLQRRPDIREAEQLLIKANAEVGVAAANYFPRIGLGAFFGGQGLDFENSLDASFAVWNFAGALAGPIFSGGRLDSEMANREANWDEMVANYRKVILIAFKETSDALFAQRSAADRRKALEEQVRALQRSVDLAMERYKAGRSAYFEVLEAEQQLYPAQYSLANARRDQLLAVVDVYKALGGSWNLTDEQWGGPAAAAAAAAPTYPGTATPRN